MGEGEGENEGEGCVDWPDITRRDITKTHYLLVQYKNVCDMCARCLGGLGGFGPWCLRLSTGPIRPDVRRRLDRIA